ncbi:hypothetical protein FC78_GL000902 [Companilactobacillus bobalius DSM 19674]|uniref:Uncharacterized protein n=1 Tax=Companilactobacillus bobalius DSM 19674 TaxID=1423788 RepID=A0A0R1KL67_9LACO|nr:hypothetical protein FC78_GL000902 [Companilactobacillus bobalius DSM 19674]
MGNTPTYAIENSTFLLDDIDKKIEKIKFSLELLAYQVIFIDGSCTEISINQSGLIVHTDANEVEDDEGLD